MSVATTKRTLLAAFAMLLLVSLPFADTITSETMVLNRIQELSYAFIGMWDMHPGIMEGSLERCQDSIEEILDYARQSDENFQLCFSDISGRLNDFCDKYHPPAKVNEEILQKLAGRKILTTENPMTGRSIQVYLLLELAKMKQSVPLTKEALDLAYRSYVAICHIMTSRTAYKHPDNSTLQKMVQEMRRGEAVHGGGINDSYEIAWCCEKFMEDMAGSKPDYLSSETLQSCEKFKSWKAAQLGEYERYLPIQHFADTMKYVASLVETFED